jgi:hypothetical protein
MVGDFSSLKLNPIQEGKTRMTSGRTIFIIALTHVHDFAQQTICVKPKKKKKSLRVA